MRILGLLTTLWTALLVFPSSLLALGLGEIETNSFLNQPLKAQIEVISARAGEIDDLLVTLASRDSFRKAGLDRPASLSKLKFTVEKAEDGQSAVIHITTKQAVTDPFLNFLLEADWGKGRLLREFTVLLDPPYFAQQDAEKAQSQPAMTDPASDASQTANVIDRAAEPATVASPSEPDQPMSQPIALGSDNQGASQTGSAMQQAPPVSTGISGDVVVRKGDTLWGIASQFQDGQHSMNQIMLAIQMMNPDAFGNENINNLKVGAVIRAPDQSSLDALNKQQAYAQVLEQNGLWDEYVARKSGSTVAGSPMARSAGATSGKESSGQLSLVTPSEGDSESASQQDDANTQNAGQIRKRLALAEEELEAARLENSDLKSRISSLEQQLKKFGELEKLVQLEDDSLAQLQQQADQPAAVSEPAADQPTESMVEAAQEIMQQSDQAPMADSSDGMKQDAPVDTMASSEAETVIQTVPEPDTGSAPDSMKEDGPPPAPVIITETPSSPVDDISGLVPSLDGLLGDPIMLGGLGGIIIILLLWWLIKRRQSSAKEDEGLTLEMPEEGADEDATPIHVAADEAETDTDIAGVSMEDTNVMDSSPADEEDQFASTAIIQAEDMPKADEPAAEQDGILDEVDVYLAYGLYDNAEELLTDSIRDNPDRADYRAKLLDTYFATKNKEAFIKEADNLRSLGGAAERFWDRVQIMGHELAPDNDMFSGAEASGLSAADLEYAKPETADFDIGSEADLDNTDFNLNEDSFDLSDTQAMDDGDDLSSTQVMDSVSDELGINLDDETEIRVEETPKTESADLPDDIGDLDMDFGAELDESAEQSAAEDDDAINFDLPEDLDLSDTMDDGAALESIGDSATETVPQVQAEEDEIAFEQDEISPEDGDDDSLFAADEADVELDLGDLSGDLGDMDLQNDEEPGSEAVLTDADEADVELDLGDLSGEPVDAELGGSDELPEAAATDDVLEIEDDSEFLDTMVETGGQDVEIEDVAETPVEDATIAMTAADMADLDLSEEPESDVETVDETDQTFDIEDDISSLDVDFGGDDFSEKDDDGDDDVVLDATEIVSPEDTETFAEVAAEELDMTADDMKDAADEMDIDDMSIDLDSADEEGTMHLEAALDMDMGNLEEADLKTSEFEVSDDIAEIEDISIDTESEDDEGTMHVEAALDMDMGNLDDADLQTSEFKASEEIPEVDATEQIDIMPELDEPDIDIQDLDSSADADIDIGDVDQLSDIDIEAEDESEPEIVDKEADESLVEDFDPNAGVEKTGTFAPGDFDEDLPEIDEPDADDIEGLMLPDDVDEVATKLDLAKAFIDMGDNEGARSSLEEVMTEGSDEQKAEATQLLDQIK